jgi:fatty acid synthase
MDACIDIHGLRGGKTGVYIGHCFGDETARLTSGANPDKTGYEVVNGAHSMAANRLSFFYDLKGPSLTLDTACSSSLVALERATRDLRCGLIDRAIVGGISLTLDPHKSASFHAFTMLSPTGRCYSFDTRADGYCRSDGVNVVIVERNRDEHACYAHIDGIGINSDGYTPLGITYPSGAMQAALMREVFRQPLNPSLTPEQVQYHEAHGTGTIVGDRQELLGLGEIYTTPMVIGSVKSNMGHCEGASGLMGLIKILLMYEDRQLYANFDFVDSPP